ncbi:MAG: HIT domain-containing protein [Candidatus Dadabacteria bacterium]|nr:HIT domain-containing protein [Candidatus Dadabacteria bacterium]NIS07428.1 HIT domain-containing protein [Candidatus Dadabacteria bacterium]NIV41618.1 HIT domain-containing protein [Candidatus Dadabacteria bacterium]NIX14621.1 HIT domain-containing protein [Candidatus Dadabacteria bacterium]NIY21084.1 HIT domain-containing protein [Candidatus Dadabacteria bacterium]
MKVLWAPWRIEYITKEKESGCVFCDTHADDNDKNNLILFRGKTCFIILNRYPYTNGHLMAVPYKHTNELNDLSAAERTELLDLTIKCKNILGIMKPNGFNIGMNLGKVAGAGIDDHLHFHVVPRWDGDTNFMPVFGSIRVMPEYLEDTYDKLKEQLESN